MKIKQFSYRLLTKNKLGKALISKVHNNFFPGSAAYWEKRYLHNGNSGNGSYGKNAAYKASFLNRFVSKNNITKIIELGCGDGNQLRLFNFPEYTGFDVSPTIIGKCRNIFAGDNTKNFYLYDPNMIENDRDAFLSALSLSLDVIYHLVEDSVFENYMHLLFSLSTNYVIIYAWDVEGEKKYHVRHRNFNHWIQKNIPYFELLQTIKSDEKDSFCDFFIYQKKRAE